jgi:hypothetical protein
MTYELMRTPSATPIAKRKTAIFRFLLSRLPNLLLPSVRVRFVSCFLCCFLFCFILFLFFVFALGNIRPGLDELVYFNFRLIFFFFSSPCPFLALPDKLTVLPPFPFFFRPACAVWRPLGFVTLSDNARSNYTARELKLVPVPGGRVKVGLGGNGTRIPIKVLECPGNSMEHR